MAALTLTTPVLAGVTVTPAAVSASDTIAVGNGGALLQIINAGGSSDTVTLVDAGTTPGGSAATNPTVAVAATTGNKIIYIPASFRSTSTGLVTVTHSFTTTVTYVVYPLG